VLRFEDLIAHTEQMMRKLADVLGISYDQILAKPTFNRQLMRANSSFQVATSGLIDEPLGRDKTLSDEERSMIKNECGTLYERTLDIALQIDRGPLPLATTRNELAGALHRHNH
jgi:hypothetical protein